MLSSSSIAQHQDDPEKWERFLEKAASGSCKAHEMLIQADIAYMVDLTGDAESPSNLHLDDYRKLFRAHFPKAPPATGPQDLADLASQMNWLPSAIRIEPQPHLVPSAYMRLWSRRTRVPIASLLNDVMIFCFNEWSAKNYFAALETDFLEYDSLLTTAGMLFLAFTWPETSPGVAID